MSDQLTYNDMLGAYSNYPAPIRPYLLRAETHPALRPLFTKSYLRVFIDVIARAPIADPSRPLMLRVDIIANHLGISTKTVTRALNLLRSKGWLTLRPGHDRRNNWGEFCAGEFILGTDLRLMLGMPVTPASAIPVLDGSQDETANLPAFAEPETANGGYMISKARITFTMSCANELVGEPVMPPSSLQEMKNDDVLDRPEIGTFGTKMSDGPIKVNKIFKKEASLKDAVELKTEKQKQLSTNVPADLQPLEKELGLLPFGIFKLMALAKRAGQTLQNIWTAKRQQILASGARQGRAFKYLAFLAECGEDFAYVASQKCVPEAPGVPGTAASPDNCIDARPYLNRKFQGNHGVLIRVHGDGSGNFSNSRLNDAYVSPKDMLPIFQAIREGRFWPICE